MSITVNLWIYKLFVENFWRWIMFYELESNIFLGVRENLCRKFLQNTLQTQSYMCGFNNSSNNKEIGH